MPKLFDYKFLITLGLSLVVYFLYKEVDTLNKRVALLESTHREQLKNTIKPIVKKQIELPPPPIPSSIPSIPQEDNNNNDNNTIEEYSNEQNDLLYSHDMLNTNTNEQDTLMVDSIVNMVNEEDKVLSESDNNIVNIINNVNNITLESLLKNKLDELQEMATELNINILTESGKKKKKVDLANEIFDKKTNMN